MQLINYNYLSTKEGQDNLRASKYRGSDNSLFYNYVYSPVCAFLVDNVAPPWFS